MGQVAEAKETSTVTAPKFETISLSHITALDDMQPRGQLDRATVEAYASAYEDGAALPPMVVFYEYSTIGWKGGNTILLPGARYWLADGFHRLAALRKIDRSRIRVELRSGGKRDALLYAVGANATHGLRRTNADKRRCVELLLTDAEWSKWADREIAKRAGVSNKFVSNVRKELAGVNGTQVTERIGGDGKVYSVSKPKTEPEPEQIEKATVEVTASVEQPATSDEDIVVNNDYTPPSNPKDKCFNCGVVAGIGCTCAMAASGFVEGMKAVCSADKPIAEVENLDGPVLLPFEIVDIINRYITFHSGRGHLGSLAGLKRPLYGAIERIEHELANAEASS